MMKKVSDVHGRVMSLTMGSDNWVVLSGLDEIKEFSMKDTATYRPRKNDVLSDLYSFEKPLGVIMADGPLWKDQRKFMMKSLREMGSGKTLMERHILDEIAYSLEFMRDQVKRMSSNESWKEWINGSEDTLMLHKVASSCTLKLGYGQSRVQMDTFFDFPCLNVIWRVASGSRFDYEDTKLHDLLDQINSFTMNPMLGPLVGVDHLKYLPIMRGYYKEIESQMNAFKTFLLEYVENESANASGYIQLFEEGSGNGSSEYFTKKQLVISMQDFFTGGSGTVSKTLAFCIYYLAHHPEYQDMARTEIQAAASCSEENELVSLEQRDLIPFTEACLLESQRMGSVLPISPPRVSHDKDVNVGSYTVPKGVPVQMNLYAMHHDNEHWGDPLTFRPHRFLNQQGTAVVMDEWLQPFGYGKRKCLGESVAKTTLLLFLANFLANFKFEKCAEDYDPEASAGGLTVGPPKFFANVVPVKLD